MKIWLDDIRPAPEGWVWRKSSREMFLDLVVFSHKIEEISFDHDLGEDSETGYDILCVIEKMVADNVWEGSTNFHIHSANPVGRKNMQAAIDSIHRMVL